MRIPRLVISGECLHKKERKKEKKERKRKRKRSLTCCKLENLNDQKRQKRVKEAKIPTRTKHTDELKRTEKVKKVNVFKELEGYKETLLSVENHRKVSKNYNEMKQQQERLIR